MRPVLVLGVVLVVLGILALAYQGITYTTRDMVIDAGPLQASVQKEETVPLPPVIGGAAIVAGVVILVVASRRRSGPAY